MKKAILVFLSFMSLTSCEGNVKEDLGLRRKAPDEFAVERKPKLEVPPSFKLRPPIEGEAPLNQVTPSEAAQKILLNNSIDATEKTSAEHILLQKAGSDRANPNIKTLLKQEYNEQKTDDIIDKLDNISKDNFDKTIVDPVKEKERIENNKKENKPITEGETPSKTINEDKPILDKIL